ncbi:hypothetical protein EN879_33670 [Mesorhizobium sp. M7A.F.Ca.AU.002.02.1.1]|uniref:hypothetical protein n=1 Tax=Mesorhizobium sp. M7A.F.Ca.AU.002.02.1.1 TaxID=2496671 RepID=UPI000FCC66E0|nr:hypothetical protein [Mesorhizobium sp. M7A.F.Ca.AU.002.02.1.1]RVC15084.1 hypothetical protein EN879_33670 [Mesorhizobium sp. M7A.F.Ca.AU.002.02.1.1]
MSMTTVAYSELTRILPWSLRALGYAFGTADRGAHIVAAGAALDPAVLDDIRQAGPRPSHGFSYHKSNGLTMLDAAGISFLETGPAAVDALAAHVSDAKWELCRISSATELSLVPATLIGAMNYNLSSIGIVARDGTFDWLLAEPDPRGVLYSGQGEDTLAALLGGETAALKSIDAARPAPGCALLMVSARRPELKESGCAAVRPGAKIALAHNKGIPVSRETLDALYGLEMLTWAPTSERSRSQAGFTVAPAPSS